jgi:hypothetical protein
MEWPISSPKIGLNCQKYVVFLTLATSSEGEPQVAELVGLEGAGHFGGDVVVQPDLESI